MGWKEISSYTKECGCECVDMEHDVDRPFMCYTEYRTYVAKRCDKHEQKKRIKKKHKHQILEEKRQVLNTHINNLTSIEDTKYILIKEAITKYRECFKIINSNRWILEYIILHLGELLLIQKIKNKWVCSEERLKAADFNLLFNFSKSEILDAIKVPTSEKPSVSN